MVRSNDCTPVMLPLSQAVGQPEESQPARVFPKFQIALTSRLFASGDSETLADHLAST